MDFLNNFCNSHNNCTKLVSAHLQPCNDSPSLTFPNEKLFRIDYGLLPRVHRALSTTSKLGTLLQHSAVAAVAEWYRTATAGSDVVQSGRPIFDDFFQHFWPYIGNNTANVVFQMVKRLWLIRIDQ
ncbi:hypothetical protein TNCV_5001311 [Trichonephila clavipes]|nr:hypothetical protein TNCV_5001311 [Trichonephila clavipes]